MIAGPNGSGKSSIRSAIDDRLIVKFINADEIEASLQSTSAFDFHPYGIQTSQQELADYLEKHPLLTASAFNFERQQFTLQNSILSIPTAHHADYLAAVLAEYIRNKLMDANESFTFETVMSHPSKLEFLQVAKDRGYRTYLYFVCNETVEINLSRIRNRVASGGHSVPDDKVERRYDASLDLLLQATQIANRSFIFDNSVTGRKPILLAEIEDGKTIEFFEEEMPAWFVKNYLDKLGKEFR